MRVLARTLLLIALIAAVPAAAQTDPPARVGRVSLISGTLAFFGPGDADWSAAKINLPVAAGAWLATDPQSRAEIRVGPESIDFANDTQLNVLDLRDKVMQLALTQGRIDLHLRRLKKDDTAEIDLPRGGVWLLEPGVYDVDSGGPDQPTRIMVFEGSARFAGGGVDTVVNAGDRLVLTGTDTLTAAVERAAPDEFVRWCRSHDYHEQRLAAPYRISPRMTGYEELDAYGEWAQAPNYGAVWYPKSLPADWAPYREGRWVWIEPWGWNWVDDEPWGFAPFHYGRWARIEDRWAWAPGEFVEEPVYAPALVAFIPPTTIESAVSVPVDAGPPVGWFPLAPGEVYWPSYSRDPAYIRNVNITNVGVAVLNTVIAGRSASADPPPQVARQQFANRTAATVVPARAMMASAPVAKAAVAVAPQVLQRAAATVQPPPGFARPSMTAASAGAPTTTAPWHGRDRAPPQPAPTASQPVAAAPAHPPARPNFAQLAPAPRVGHAGATNTQPASPPPSAQATRQPEIPSRSLPQAGTQVVPPAAMPAHPPGPPDFAHLPPARIGPHGMPRPPQQLAPSAPGAPRPSSEHANAPQPPASGTTTPPRGPQAQPDFAPLSPHRGAPQPPPPAQLAQPSPNEAPVAQQRAAAEAAARQQARQRAAAEAAARQQEAQQRAAVQQAQQRAATEAARQQSQQRGAAQAEVRQQAQQRAAAESAARQQAQQRAATEAAARQEAQRRAAAESAARQQAAAQAAQQRATAEASARQQAQQRAAAEAAARQQAAAAQQRTAAEAAARQQAAAATQQRAAAEAARQQAAAQQRTAAQAAAAQQAAQQRAAGQAAAAQQAAQQRAASQQAQQRAAAQAAARQHQAEACGHPGQPACPH